MKTKNAHHGNGTQHSILKIIQPMGKKIPSMSPLFLHVNGDDYMGGLENSLKRTKFSVGIVMKGNGGCIREIVALR